MSEYTYDDTLAALQRVVSNNPEGRNEKCVYTEFDKPVCIIGHVLVDLKLDPGELEGMEAVAEQRSSFTRFGFTADAVDLMQDVQFVADQPDEEQDGLYPLWIEALDMGLAS